MLIKRVMLISATVLGLSVCGQAVSVVFGNPAASDIYVTPNPTSTFTLVRGGFGGHGGFGGGMGGRGFAMGGMGARGFAMGGRGFAMGGLGRPSVAMGAPRSFAASGPRGTLFAAAGVSGFHLQNGRFIQGRFIHGRFFPGRFVNRRFFPRIGVGLGWGSTYYDYGYGEGGSCYLNCLQYYGPAYCSIYAANYCY